MGAKWTRALLGGLTLVVPLSGCCAARFIETNPHGGVVAIPTNTNSWPYYHRDKAVAMIQEKCPQGYEIEKEEEVVVGQTHSTNTNTRTTGDPLLAAMHIAPVNQESTQTVNVQDKTEWRIRYRTKDAPSPSQPVPPLTPGSTALPPRPEPVLPQ